MINVKKSKLRVEQTTTGGAVIGAGAHVDVALGMFDRPGPNPDNGPAIVPTEMVATQLSTARPPIDDEDYVPTSLAELAIAAAEIAKLVPIEQIGKFYLRLKDLSDESVDRQEVVTLNKKEDMTESKIKKMIREALDDMDEPEVENDNGGIFSGRETVPYGDIIGAHPEEFEDVKPHRRYSAALKADQSGRQKMMMMIEQLPAGMLDKIHNVAKDEYIDLFEEIAGDEADAEDIADLKKLPSDELYEMSDSYKFFFKAAFVLPVVDAYQKRFRAMARVAYENLTKKLKDAGVPSTAVAAVGNQMFGWSTKDAQTIMKKFFEAGDAGEIPANEVQKRYRAFMQKYPTLESNAKKELNNSRLEATKTFIENSLSNYSKMSLDQRKKIMQQAFEKLG